MRLPAFAAELLPAALRGGSAVPPPAPASADGGADEVSTFNGLLERLSYLGKADLKLVREAYKFADEAHLGQMRATGQPYITHPIAVAALVAGWRLDVQAVMAALLHDTIEDQGVKKAELIERFGAPTADMVDGLTKLDKLQFSTREEGQAENFRKMLLAMARDVRIILVKLADRLHNMRTMGAMAPAKSRRIARETLDIYAPIAYRLGLNETYRELQELCFRYLHPWRHAALTKAVQRARGHRRDVIERVQMEVEHAFARRRIKVSVSGREKTPYSIYRKMRERRASFTAVSDLFGFRVLLPGEDSTQCYLALGVLHQTLKPVPGRFKDYIAIPKANGYQSLHTTLLSPLGTPVEFQVRTEGMHAVAEKGVAAHWLYKSKGDAASAAEAQRMSAIWLQSLIDIQDETRDAAEFLEHVKIDLHPEAVYVFTPRGKILALPRGATVVDFAYAIHSDVGDHTVAAKVNGESVALRTTLASGDVVEIVTAPGARPNPAWLASVRTGRARSKIRHFLKNLETDEARQLGERLLAQALKAEGLAMPSEDPNDTAAAALWQQLARWSGVRSRADLMGDLGLGRKIAGIVAKRLAQMMAEQGVRPDAVSLTLGRYGAGEDAAAVQGVVFLDGGEGASIQYAPCCRPIPGDPIVGYLGRGEGLLVHTADCPSGRRQQDRDPERWMQVAWAEEPTRAFETTLNVTVGNGKGVLAQVAGAISSTEADITHLDMDPETKDETVELRLLVSVRDRGHLAEVLRMLRRVPAVKATRRYRHAPAAA